MLTNPECNEAAGEFVRNKIRAIVHDEKTAELLCPHYTILSKRPPLGHQYYEAFNRENVSLVDVRSDPIEAITPTGLRTSTTEYDFDLIIFAVGFDAITGTLAKINLRNAEDQLLSEQLKKNMATAYVSSISPSRVNDYFPVQQIKTDYLTTGHHSPRLPKSLHDRRPPSSLRQPSRRWRQHRRLDRQSHQPYA